MCNISSVVLFLFRPIPHGREAAEKRRLGMPAHCWKLISGEECAVVVGA